MVVKNLFSLISNLVHDNNFTTSDFVVTTASSFYMDNDAVYMDTNHTPK